LRSLLVAISLAASLLSFAGTSGYIENGKETIVFRDGKKVGEYPMKKNQDRQPAGSTIEYTSDLRIFFVEDDVARCYFGAADHKNHRAYAEGPISCVKK
jgi:hypothetical protein